MRTRVVIVIEGDNIQHILSDTPCDVMVVDYTDGDRLINRDPGEPLTMVPQPDGSSAPADCRKYTVELNPDEVEQLFKLKPEPEYGGELQKGQAGSSSESQ